jgi:integrase
MSRPKPPRLYLKEQRRPRANAWYIRDGKKRIGTGCGEEDLEGAERVLREYLNEKYQPPSGFGSDLLVVEAVAAYLKDYASHSRSKEFLFATAEPLLAWWGGKKVRDVNGINCRRYVAWRTSHFKKRHPRSKKPPVKVSDQTARHDLKTLRAAINWYKREWDPDLVTPTVTLPKKAPPRLGYCLERSQVAARIRAARENAQTRHVARMLLIGIYTGTRPGAILALRWLPSIDAGWFDLEAGILYRTGSKVSQSKKRQPPAKIHGRLIPHLRRWRDADMACNITSVVHYKGERVRKLRRSWESVAKLAGSRGKDSPHILRHTAATWMMRSGVDAFEASGFLGMTPEILWEVYGHHHPKFQESAAAATGKRERPKVGRSEHLPSNLPSDVLIDLVSH